ncbi:hypothetical protein BGZ83_001166 [Gryganskiella cystojenkinii]|nr:hypothetical protein BGZ83_001166 [Gryganskiella cystojenkinii]
MRQLTLLQRQRITLSLFFTVAVGAVFTVAAPAFVPWQVVDEKRAQALDQQRRQGKDFHVVPSPRTTSKQADGKSQDEESSRSSLSSHSAPISSQGPLISLLTDRSKKDALTEDASPSSSLSTAPSITSDPQDPNNPETVVKKRRRRRKRTKVNEGWQELTGRTAREEQEKHQHTHSEKNASNEPAIGENGGKEISWKNKERS